MNDIDLLNKYYLDKNKKTALKKLNGGYPIQYIIGNVDFYGINIKVDERVLIPRFETEYLVEKTIKYLKKLNITNPKILEIGTGSGCISIALKKLIACDIDAIDINNNAIKLAKDNAKINNVLINFENINIEEFKSNKKYDLIISNPPYVNYNEEIANNLKYEPSDAIFAPDNGLYFYNIILNNVINNLTENYLIAFEIDDKQGNYIKDLAINYLNNPNVIVEKDYNNLERYIFITNNKL